MLYKPSNLSPNFEEIILKNKYVPGGQLLDPTWDFSNDQVIKITFTANTSGSCIRSYKIEVLKAKNDQNDIENNILCSCSGTFLVPLHNKDTGTIELNRNKIYEMLGLESGTVNSFPLTDIRWRIRLYEDDCSEKISGTQLRKYTTTYGRTAIGNGYLVGTTRNVIWTGSLNDGMVEERFIEQFCYSDNDLNDFKPFNIEDGKRAKILAVYDPNATILHDRYRIQVDLTKIQAKYKELLTSGNMYVALKQGDSYLGIVRINQIEYESNKTYLVWEEDQGKFSTRKSDGTWYVLIYRQREEISQVDKGIGQRALNKIVLKEPMKYNQINYGAQSSEVSTKLYSDKFQYNKVYIYPVPEFDSKSAGNAYINIRTAANNGVTDYYYGMPDSAQFVQNTSATWNPYLYFTWEGTYTSQAIPIVDKPANWSETYTSYYQNKYYAHNGYDIIPRKNAFTLENNIRYTRLITNYVGTTGECALFSNLDFMPDVKYQYDIFQVDQTEQNAVDDNPVYLPLTQKTQVLFEDADNNLKFYDDCIYYYVSGDHKFIVYHNSDGTRRGISMGHLASYQPNVLYHKVGKIYTLLTQRTMTENDWNQIKDDCYWINIENPYISESYYGSFRTAVSNGNIFYLNNQYYLGGGTNKLGIQDPVTIESNVYDTEKCYYRMFVQPNIGLSPDENKPCSLTLQNDEYSSATGYITNFGGDDSERQAYNKNISIDKLDESQYLVSFTIPGDTAGALSKDLLFPQTSYKIYSNFIDSVPEAYVYLRPDKKIEFTNSSVYNISFNPLDVTNDLITYAARDIKVTAEISDSGPTDTKQNTVSNKLYYYTVESSDSGAEESFINLYTQDVQFDDRYEIVYRGMENGKYYRFTIYVEDDLSHVFSQSEILKCQFTSIYRTDTMNVQADCARQANFLNFTPVRQFQASGTVGSLMSDHVLIQSDPLTFSRLEDGTDQTISLPYNWIGSFKVGLNSSLLDNDDTVASLLKVTDDCGNILEITIDMRPYIVNDGAVSLNDGYFKMTASYQGSGEPATKTTDDPVYTTGFLMPEKLLFLAQDSSHTYFNQNVYWYVEQADQVSVPAGQTQNFAPPGCMEDNKYYIPDASDYNIFASTTNWNAINKDFFNGDNKYFVITRSNTGENGTIIVKNESGTEVLTLNIANPSTSGTATTKVEFGKSINFYGFNFGSTDYPGEDVSDSTFYSYANSVLTLNLQQTAVYTASVLASDQYVIYRREPSHSIWNYVGYISGVGPEGVYDYAVAAGKSYKYLIAPNPESSDFTDITTKYFVRNNWEQWSLVDCVYDNDFDLYRVDLSDDVYLFDKNISIGSIGDNAKIITYETLGRFNKIIRNKQNFASGDFSCLLNDFTVAQNIYDGNYRVCDIDECKLYKGDQAVKENILDWLSTAADTDKIKFAIPGGQEEIFYSADDLRNPDNYQNIKNLILIQNGEYYSCTANMTFIIGSEPPKTMLKWNKLPSRYILNHDPEKLIQWRNFISNGKTKLLKSPAGEIWIIGVADATHYDINHTSSQYPVTIAFTWKELASIDETSVLGW